MKCPVCNTECGSKGNCPNCGFDQLHVEFLNYEEAKVWEQTVVSEFRRNFISKGSTMLFGKYYYDNKFETKPIKWSILERTEDKVLLITDNSIECKRFYSFQADITWEESPIRAWLNGDFYNMAFDDEEKGAICKSLIKPDKNPDAPIVEGKTTSDYIFLLSLSEANKYFPSQTQLKCHPSPYAFIEAGFDSEFDDYKESKAWWLRTPGYGTLEKSTLVVDRNGYIDNWGYMVSSDYTMIRPAMWVSKKADRINEY